MSKGSVVVDEGQYDYVISSSSLDPSAPPTHQLRPKVTKPALALSSRAARREAKRQSAKLRKKTLAHACVLDSAAIKAGAQVQIQQGPEQHRLHVAMGEPWCTACTICSDRRAKKLPATVLNERERAALLELWSWRVDEARGGPDVELRLMMRAAIGG